VALIILPEQQMIERELEREEYEGKPADGEQSGPLRLTVV